ncbi:hypothetical protein LCGC14_2728050 [marine sediment metagenome]|uniref:Uncharacterized protein n=1 Tax=marine sediment metagenome TaxID=412755 RepID=A0A0F8Z8B4_9ZZZZ
MTITEFFVIWAVLLGVFFLGYITGQKFGAYRLHDEMLKAGLENISEPEKK